MAAVSGQSAGGDGAPSRFEHAVESLRAAAVRPEVKISPARAPQRLAPYSHAVTGTVVSDGEELADGRFVLLHDPEGHEGWRGTFRIVTLTRAELEPEMAADPLLPDVGWSWLTGALDARGVRYREPSGTVSRCSSHYFGGLSGRPESTQMEIRASWTPDEQGEGPDVGAHLAAWCDLLCTSGGLPPSSPGAAPDQGHDDGGGVVSLPPRRSPRGT